MPRRRAPTFFKVEIKRSTRLPARASSPALSLGGESITAAERLFGRPTTSIPARVIKDGGRELRQEPTKASGPTEGADGAITKTPQPIRILPDLQLRDPVEVRIRQEEERIVQRPAVRVRRPARRAWATRDNEVHVERTEGPALTKGRAVDDTQLGKGDGTAPAAPISPVFDGLSAPEPVNAPKPERSSNLRSACQEAKRRGLPLPRLSAGSRWKRHLPWMCW